MKKFGFMMMAAALAAFTLTSCDPNKKPTDLDNVVEDGFYVIGEATAIPTLAAENAAKGLMAAGTNEVDKAKRAGMYEKYIALEGGKDFELVLREGETEVRYGAELALSDTLEGDGVPQIQVYQGVMAENTKMQVPVSGLYHIILDLNVNGDLKDKLIMVAPVEWGVRGAMNGWGYTAMTAPAFNKESMTFVLEEALVKEAGQFKFAHSNGWKFQLDQAGLVKAENNFGSDAAEDGGDYTTLLPGGKNLPIARGYWKIELKWDLNGGALEKSFTYTPTKTADYVPAYEHLYMIGADFGNWNWESDGIVELTAVNQNDGGKGEGQFWAVRYFTAANGFKFSTEKDWGVAFNIRGDLSEASVAYTLDGDGNIHVPADGFYMIHIDLANNKMAIEEAQVYGIGVAFGAWDKEMDAAKFVANGSVMEVTTSADGDLRIYATSSIVDTDWWTREFNIFEGKIVYRGVGGDQAAVPVTAGKKITLDFNAGTGSIQ